MGGTAGLRREPLTSLCASGCDGEAMVPRVVAGARAHPWRIAVDLGFLGRGCFAGAVVKWVEEKAVRWPDCFYFFDSLCLYFFNGASDC